MSRLLAGAVLFLGLAVSLISSLHLRINKNSIWPTGGRMDIVDYNTTHDTDTTIEHLQVCPRNAIQEYSYGNLPVNLTGYRESTDAYFVMGPTFVESDRITAAMDKPISSLLALNEELQEAQRKIVEKEQSAKEAWKRVEELEKALLRAEETRKSGEQLQEMANIEQIRREQEARRREQLQDMANIC